jgi:hypothetical protein
MQNKSRGKFIRDISLASISISPIIQFLSSCSSNLPKKDSKNELEKFVDCAFRLCDARSLLNLEFYFINCEKKGNNIIAHYGQAENYMIVRLPQQHISEDSFSGDQSLEANKVVASSRIAGFSYLVFRILFDKCNCSEHNKISENGEHLRGFNNKTAIKLNKEDLLDWNNEHKFRLVVRQDLTKPIFEYSKNNYPFGYDTLGTSKKDTTLDKYDYNNVPKIEHDPITALELPFGLILSPKLPDSNLYKFRWDIPDTKLSDYNYKLWTAILSIEKRKEPIKKTDKDNGKQVNTTLSETISTLEAMIIGNTPILSLTNAHITDKNRKDLVILYIQYKLLAKLDKLMFTPLGASTHINLYNSLIKETSQADINLLEWDQVISFGRDEEIKTSTLTLEKHFGHKMAVIDTSKRQLIKGRMQLVQTKYLMPLDVEKDYTSHQTQETSNGIATKFGSPFKKIKFLDTEPRKLEAGLPNKTTGETKVNFQFEAEDWAGGIVNFEKFIFLTREFDRESATEDNKILVSVNPEVFTIDSLTSAIAEKQLEVDNIYANFSNKLSPSANATIRDFILSNTTKDSITFNKDTFLVNKQERIFDEKIFNSRDTLNQYVVKYDSFFKNEPHLVNKLYAFHEIKEKKIANDLASDAKKILDIEALIRKQKEKVEEVAKSIEGFIKLKKEEICYAVGDIKNKVNNAVDEVVNKAGNQINNKLSQLKTDYIVFAGKPMINDFDYFNEFAIIPNLKLAQVYIPVISDLVNKDLPLTIEYAQDYLKSQVDTLKLETQANVARVFMKLTEHAQDAIQKTMDTIAAETAGFNLSLPGEYLTFLKNPEETLDRALSQAEEQLKKEHPEIEQAKNTINKAKADLVLIRDEAKQAMKSIEDLKNMDPKVFFKQFKTWFFSNFPLEELLDIGFDLPILHKMDDKLVYLFATSKLKEYNASFLRFTPNYKSDEPTSLNIYVEKSTVSAKKYFTSTKLNNFSIGIYSGNTEILSVLFDKFLVTSSHDRAKKFEIKIDDVKFGGSLEFIANLAKKICMPADGLLVKPSKNGIVVEYAVPLPDVNGAAMQFRNLNLTAGVKIPFEKSDTNRVQFTFGINSPNQKFLVAAGLYGGGGHFLMTASPTGIEAIDFSLEMGAYAKLDIGIAKGEVKLFFGLWFVAERDELNRSRIKAVAYMLCAGNATVFGFISISVRIMLALTYIKENGKSKLFGEASVTYKVKIAFFQKSFTVHYYKEIVGSNDNGSESNNLGAQQAGLLDIPFSNPFSKSKSKKAETLFENDEYITSYLNAFN